MIRVPGDRGGRGVPGDGPRSGQRVHSLRVRVVMRDVDSVNIHYASFYDWMDRGLGGLLAAAGHPISRIFRSGFALPVVQSGCTYLAPVDLDVIVEVRSWVSRAGRTSFTVSHDFRRAGDRKALARGALTCVWVKRPAMTPRSVPSWIRGLAAAGRRRRRRRHAR